MSSSNNVTDVAKSQEELCAEKELRVELWPMHFPGDEFDHENNEKVIIIGLLTSFFTAHADVYLKRREAEERGCVSIDFNRFKVDIPVRDFETFLKTQPRTILGYLSLAVHLSLVALNDSFRRVPIRVRLVNYGPIQSMKSITSSLVETYIAITCTVVRVSAVRPMVVSVPIVCSMCGTRQILHFLDGRMPSLGGCSTPGCRGGTRAREMEKHNAVVTDFQRIRVHDILTGADSDDSVRIPRSIDCELTNDLVDTCFLGDVVTLTGIVKVLNSDNAAGCMWHVIPMDRHFG